MIALRPPPDTNCFAKLLESSALKISFESKLIPIEIWSFTYLNTLRLR